MDYLFSGLTVFGLVLVAAMSPGPDFLIVIRHALKYGRREGVVTAWGIAAAIFVHVGYAMVGIGILIAQSVFWFNVVKWLGAAYLLYMGVMALRSRGWSVTDIAGTEKVRAELPARKAFRAGFITNVLNPKATLFFLALFTQVIDPATPRPVMFGYGVICAATAGTWFTIVSYILSHRRVRASFTRASAWIDRATGLAFIGLAVKLALSKAAMKAAG